MILFPKRSVGRSRFGMDSQQRPLILRQLTDFRNNVDLTLTMKSLSFTAMTYTAIYSFFIIYIIRR